MLLNKINQALMKGPGQRQGITTHNNRHRYGYWAQECCKISPLIVTALLHHRIQKQANPSSTTARYVLAGSDLQATWNKMIAALEQENNMNLICSHKRWEILLNLHRKQPKDIEIPFSKHEISQAWVYDPTIDPIYLAL